MELKFNVKGKERKSLVSAIAEILGQKAEYQGAPTMAYRIGEYTVDKKGTVTGEYSLGLMVALTERGFDAEESETFHLITPRGTLLIRERFDTVEQAEQAGYGMYFSHKGRDIYTRLVEGAENSVTFAMVGKMFEETDIPEDAEEPETTPNRLTIEYPLDGFTPEKLDNLKKLVESKDVLIKKALEIAELPIEETDQTLRFPWFPAYSHGDKVNAYSQFICALCDTAKKKNRVVAKAQESFENERFAMRVWLIGMGLVGSEYVLCRKIFLAKMDGNSGYRYGKPEDGAVSRRDGIHREAISIRLIPDTLEKLNAIAQTYEGLSRNKLIEQIVERYVDAESLAADLESAERINFMPEGE